MLCCSGAYPQDAVAMVDSLIIQDARNNFVHVRYVPEIEEPLFTVLNYFPELQETNIKFKYKNIRTTMVSRPTLLSLFRKERTFVVYIDNFVRKNNGISFQAIPLDAKIGLIGHELCHIIDYESKSSLQILAMGIKYACSRNHYEVESHVDKLTIEKGLGPELYAWTDYIINASEATEKYKSYKMTNYLAPAEILMEIENQKLVQP